MRTAQSSALAALAAGPAIGARRAGPASAQAQWPIAISKCPKGWLARPPPSKDHAGSGLGKGGACAYAAAICENVGIQRRVLRDER
eukprot:1289253-Alexandrium_andersonii.AAC.1